MKASLTIMDLDLQITWKHPVYLICDTIRMDRRITLQIGGYQMCEGRTLCSLVLEGMLSY